MNIPEVQYCKYLLTKNIFIPPVTIFKDNNYIKFSWDNLGIGIIFHSEGIILTDALVPDEDLLEYSYNKMEEVLNYQVNKIISRIDCPADNF